MQKPRSDTGLYFYRNTMEIGWKYNGNSLSKLREIGDSIRISMAFHEANCVMQTLALYPSVFDQSIGLVVVESCLA